MTVKVYDSELDLMKAVLAGEFNIFMNMIECVGAPPRLDYKKTTMGVKVHFSVEQEET